MLAFPSAYMPVVSIEDMVEDKIAGIEFLLRHFNNIVRFIAACQDDIRQQENKTY